MIDYTNINFDEKGLIPVVVQDGESGEVLMVAYANRQSLEETEKRKEVVFWSRSRQLLWHKGETSGNTLRVMELRLDCDGDAILAVVEPAGPACHTGEVSCFFRTLTEEMPGKATFPGQLWKYLKERQHHNPKESYTASLIQSGPKRAAQKIGEEGVETALAIAVGERDEVIYEAADLVYHLMVGLLSSGVSLQEIWAELEKRHSSH